MKKIIALLFLLLSGMSLCGQQTGDLEDFYIKLEKYASQPRGGKMEYPRPPKGTYLQDRTGILTPYYGTWVGSYKDFSYIFYLGKRTRKYETFMVDALDTYCYVLKTTGKKIEVSQYLRPKIDGDDHFKCTLHPDDYMPTSRDYGFFYSGVTDAQYAKLYLRLLENGTIELSIFDFMVDGFPEGSQVFPIYDPWARDYQYSYLTKVSSDTLHLQLPASDTKAFRSDIDPVFQSLIFSGILSQKSHKSFLSCWDASFLNKLKLIYEPSKSELSDKCFEPKLRPGDNPNTVITLPEEDGSSSYYYGPDSVCLHRDFGKIDWPRWTKSYTYDAHPVYLDDQGRWCLFFNGGASKPFGSQHSTEDLVALSYKLLVHAYLLNSFPAKGLKDRRELARRYGRDFRGLLQAYAEKKGISLKMLKTKLMEDARWAVRMGFLGNESKILSQIELCLSGV